MLLASEGAGRLQYSAHVAAMWGWLQPIEGSLWDQLLWPPDIEPVARASKRAWLWEDLLTARSDGFLPAEPALCGHAPDFSSVCTRYGWAYVIEGSMLGGQVLRRRLADRLSPWPTRYLQGYREYGGVRWRSFLAALERDIAGPAQRQATGVAAAEAFSSISDWLQLRGCTA